MSIKNFFLTVYMAVFLCLSIGCTAIQSVGDYLSENPVFANIAARQAVGRYIAAGGTIQEEQQRAASVQKRITKVLAYIDGNPETDVDNLLLVINSVVDWDELTPADRLLVQDIILLVEEEIRQYDTKGGGISDTATFAIRALFQTAVDTALIYLSR